jgi:aspartate/methionine/tyrosine aminotransferase
MFAARVKGLKAEGAYEILARAKELERQGQSVIHLEIGEPDRTTFENVRQAGIEAIERGQTRYTPSAGERELREAIALDAGIRRGIQIDPAQVVVSPGAKPNLFFPVLALVEPEDEVIYPDPGFPTYRAMIEVAGGVPVPVPLLESRGFSYDLDALNARISSRTKLIVLNSPGNPTGGIIPADDLEAVAELAQQHNCWVLSDEIYARIVYEGEVQSIASIDTMADRTIIMDGFSKTYCMTGWRLGFGIMPETLAKRVSLLLTHSLGCTAQFTQIAGIEALRGSQEQVAIMVERYRERRDLIVQGLRALPGVSCVLPRGAFYAFPNISKTGLSSDVLADRLLKEAGVALLPGTAFGMYGEGYLRISYANSLQNLEEALERMRGVFGRIAQ